MKKQASYSKILRGAAHIADEREPQYGKVLENLQDTSDVARIMFGLQMSPVEIAQLLIALKVSREKFKHKPDNILDTINYNAIHLLAIENENPQPEILPTRRVRS